MAHVGTATRLDELVDQRARPLRARGRATRARARGPGGARGTARARLLEVVGDGEVAAGGERRAPGRRGTRPASRASRRRARWTACARVSSTTPSRSRAARRRRGSSRRASWRSRTSARSTHRLRARATGSPPARSRSSSRSIGRLRVADAQMRSRKRSICDSGSGYVPKCSGGFCVAMTMNGCVELVRGVVDRDLAFAHRLEQRRLRARRGAVDLVGEDDVREDRAALELEHLAAPGCR